MAEVMKWIVSVILLNRNLEIKQELKKYSKQNEVRPIWLRYCNIWIGQRVDNIFFSVYT